MHIQIFIYSKLKGKSYFFKIENTKYKIENRKTNTK